MRPSILSVNSKTGVSLNLPTTNCRPTEVCRFCCYGRHHFIGHGRKCLAKWDRNSRYLAGNDISELIKETGLFSAVRISGTGDILPEHVPNLIKLAKACPRTRFWGMTRKPELAKAINDGPANLCLLVTVDAATPASVWDNYAGAICYGPRRATDQVPNDPRIITVFPYHNSGKVVGNVPEHRLDCPAVRHRTSGCPECGRCWSWKGKSAC